MPSDPAPSLRDLYPKFDEAQLRQAEEIFDRYIALTLRIYERIRNDPAAWTLFESLTAEIQNPTMEDTPPP